MICQMDQDGLCSTHGRRHIGHAAILALEDSEKAERIRRLWDGKAAPVAPQKLSFLQKATRYAKALARHKANGSLIVPDDVRATRRVLCDACDLRDPDKDECKVCGCSLHATILGDKLAWASESCPKAKWGTWTEPAPVPPPVDADWPPGQEPAFLALALHVEGLPAFRVTLPRLTTGVTQSWASQGSAPVWGRTDKPCDGSEASWFSPFDWTATVYRFTRDGPNKRFVLSLERFTPEHCVRLLASKLALLSLTPFLAVGQGVLMCGEQGGACTPCKGLALAPWSVTLTEGQA
jgi:hypothetical protein